MIAWIPLMPSHSVVIERRKLASLPCDKVGETLALRFACCCRKVALKSADVVTLLFAFVRKLAAGMLKLPIRSDHVGLPWISAPVGLPVV